jgi:hypothetical protein
MLDALKGRRQTPAPEPVASTSTNVASARPAARIKPSPEDMRLAHERRLAMLRVRRAQSTPEPERAVTPNRTLTLPTRLDRTRRAVTDNRYSHIAGRSRRYRNALLRLASRCRVF